MPQVLALIAAGAGLYAGYKWVSRAFAELQKAQHTREAGLRDAMARSRGEPKDLGALEMDPATGVYRPRSK